MASVAMLSMYVNLVFATFKWLSNLSVTQRRKFFTTLDHLLIKITIKFRHWNIALCMDIKEQHMVHSDLLHTAHLPLCIILFVRRWQQWKEQTGKEKTLEKSWHLSDMLKERVKSLMHAQWTLHIKKCQIHRENNIFDRKFEGVWKVGMLGEGSEASPEKWRQSPTGSLEESYQEDDHWWRCMGGALKSLHNGEPSNQTGKPKSPK